MNRLKVVETLKHTLYSMAGTTAAGFLSITVFLHYGIFEGDLAPLDMPVSVALSLVAVPTGLALLGWAAGRWEKSIQDKKLREKRPPQPREKPGGADRPES
ncbi:heme/copper-type cytochrome/quinol oxidase subunit 1 [Salinibacter ruber]|jgi:heme/copper-type cytochrome/quinol oxidase subunit 1|uniref:Heme/copper-type cytochrome/quinol oxidase subunit 1 n=1 Tax=Salinibacter ruber TaxID=146919 RepID=A0A9X2UM95_9BACT|nr:hypothetical protein [Salinibacter ruber]MBB4070556.1 heme/copper-type cytochrome/quinol oxidase subunit 1 [Salinibacter ruber]MCS3616746.1 heme/copper-type cytochrome/quinol oxidase subunit 1 [Salinibacter ruber]MCS3629007.1 heme/copper-type cytochrome/quinol oxidase subunit 1 [Salinibacter ruber]MCS3632106.1 heme/copper-type cytochrome/quinol oxidase subunit 1 [Salinibacter ruber]MCS3668292.1 heme/copper-type cytochrome/quinol oxidase subunit 1 [Salinibacter ruber]